MMTSSDVEAEVGPVDKIGGQNKEAKSSTRDNFGARNANLGISYENAVRDDRNSQVSVISSLDMHKQPSPSSNQLHISSVHRHTHNIECSSNQSGSDSGLGYTNSFSSDNSYVVKHEGMPAAKNSPSSCRTGSEQVYQRNLGNTDKIKESSGAASSSELASEDGYKNEIPKVGINRIFHTASPNSNPKNTDGKIISRNDLNRVNTKTGHLFADAVTTASAPSIHTINDCLASNSNNNSKFVDKHNRLIDTFNKQPDSSVASSKPNTNQSEVANQASSVTESRTDDSRVPLSVDHGSGSIGDDKELHADEAIRNELDRDGSTLERDSLGVKSHHHNNPSPLASSISPGSTSKTDVVPFLRSALKKSSINSVNVPLSGSKTQRNVTFNQTVIVFCEELETSSMSDQFNPPAEYQDADTTSNLGPSVSGKDDQKTIHDYDNCDIDILSRLLGKEASKITDEQLFSLLTSGSVNEEFNPSIDDCTDDEEFTMERLNSDQSYLCRGAISDSDSDSLPVQNNMIEESTARMKPRVNSVANLKNSIQIKGEQSSFSIDNQDIKQSKRCSQQSLPARMKVTTLENSKKKRSSLNNIGNTKESKQFVENEKNLKESNFKNKYIDTADQTLSQPMKIKQTNIEPITKVRTAMVNSNSREITVKQGCQNQTGHERAPISSVSTTSSFAHSSADLADMCQPTLQQQSLAETSNKEPLTTKRAPVKSQITQDHSQLKAQVDVAQSSCHMCRALDAGQRMPGTNQQNVASTKLCSSQISVVPPQRSIANAVTVTDLHHSLKLQPPPEFLSQPVPAQLLVSNKGCASCRDASLIHGPNLNTNQARPYGLHARPIACQLVYVIDQNGNKIKALQVIGNQANLDSARNLVLSPIGGRFQSPGQFVTPQGVRYNPVSQQVGSGISNQQGDTQAVRIQQAVDTYDASSPPAHITSTMISCMQQNQRQHTVYCVKQPLGAQNLRQSIDSDDLVRPFPDPHEVRRLDGLRGPTNRISLAQRNNQEADMVRHQVDPRHGNVCNGATLNDDSDDPTFGFSNRPAVKVVQVGLKNGINIQSINAQRVSGAALCLTAQAKNNNQITSNLSGQILSNFESMTLDRRNVGQAQELQNSVYRDNQFPSTSSLSNLNKIANNQNELATGNNATFSRISRQMAMAPKESMNKLTKGTIRVKRWFDREVIGRSRV